MAVKTRWDQKTYRRHRFNQGRGVRSPHEVTNTPQGTAEFIDSQLQNGGWWEATWRGAGAGKLSAAKEYEQYNNPASRGFSPFTSDSDERRKFREQDRKEVRQQFAQALKDHHFVQDRKVTQGRLDKIVDAYMSQDDDRFQKTLRSMGVSDRDAVRFTRAAEEAASKAIEGKDYGGSWSDDSYQKNPVIDSTNGGSEPLKPAGQTKATGPANGQKQVKTVPASAPLAPRNPRPAAPETVVGTTGRFGSTGLATDSRVRVNGAPLDIRNTQAQGALARTQAETLTADAIKAAEHRKDVQSAAATADVDRLHSRRVAAFQQEKNRQELRDAQDQFREQQRAAMMERRYKNRSFRDADDWKNLGTLREGEQMLDQKDYDAKVGDLVKRARKLRSAEGRAGLGASDLQDMDMVFKTVGKLPTTKDDNGNVSYGGNLTPAQIEALEKRIGGFESRAQDSRDRTAARVAALNSRAADAYREQYGLQGFSDEDVLAFHNRRRGQSVGKALAAIAAIGTPKDADGVRGYEEAWDVIRRNADVTGAFNRAMEDHATKDRFMEDSAAITGEDAAMRREDLRRSAVIAQLNKERQPRQTEQGANLAAGFSAPVPAAQAPAEDPLRAAGIRVPAKTGATGDVTKNDVPVTVLFPRKKKEDTQAATLAGTVLRPRTRR